MKYEAVLYCETIEGWFYASTKAVNVTAKDNGGKTVGMTLTYKKAISDVTDNAVVLNICCKLAESMAVPKDRVTDAYGGYCKKPSHTLPDSAPTVTTTTNKTRILNTTNKTTTSTKQTEWKLDRGEFQKSLQSDELNGSWLVKSSEEGVPQVLVILNPLLCGVLLRHGITVHLHIHLLDCIVADKSCP